MVIGDDPGLKPVPEASMGSASDCIPAMPGMLAILPCAKSAGADKNNAVASVSVTLLKCMQTPVIMAEKGHTTPRCWAKKGRESDAKNTMQRRRRPGIGGQEWARRNWRKRYGQQAIYLGRLQDGLGRR